MPIQPGERISVKAPGGGGFGEPGKRDKRAVVADVLEGYVSAEKAAQDYGFEESWIEEYAPGEGAALGRQ